MTDNFRIEIEELLNNYLRAISKEGDKTFFTSQVTADFIEMGADCESKNSTQLMMPDSHTFGNDTLKSGKIDLINKLEISDDSQFVFFAFTATMTYEHKMLFGVTNDLYNMNILSGYAKKIDGKWKLAWIQQSMKYIDVDEDE